jgi:hypothetical protein
MLARTRFGRSECWVSAVLIAAVLWTLAGSLLVPLDGAMQARALDVLAALPRVLIVGGTCEPAQICVRL